jgi:hypothetical protein
MVVARQAPQLTLKRRHRLANLHGMCIVSNDHAAGSSLLRWQQHSMFLRAGGKYLQRL